MSARQEPAHDLSRNLMPQFVILHHTTPPDAERPSHWDFMLESEDCLVTWQMAAEPSGPEACPIACTRIHDHRKHYLDYEGPFIGGRGVVSRYEWGTYELLAASENSWTVRLRGARLTGDFRLHRPDPNSRSTWTFTQT